MSGYSRVNYAPEWFVIGTVYRINISQPQLNFSEMSADQQQVDIF